MGEFFFIFVTLSIRISVWDNRYDILDFSLVPCVLLWSKVVKFRTKKKLSEQKDIKSEIVYSEQKKEVLLSE